MTEPLADWDYDEPLLDDTGPSDPKAPIVRTRKSKKKGRAKTDDKISSFQRSAWGDMMVAQAYWWNSPFEMILKLVLALVYVAMGTMSIAFEIPMVFNYVGNALVYFVLCYVIALVAGAAFGVAVCDGFRLGLSFKSKDPLGREAIVSFRDRMFHVALAGMSLAVALYVAITWTIWFGINSDLRHNSDFNTFSRGVAQYYALLAQSGALFIFTPFLAVVMLYTNVRYKFGVFLLDTVLRRIRNQSLEKVLHPEMDETEL